MTDIGALLARARLPERTTPVQVADEVVTFRLRALPSRKWSALVDEHPPRDGNRDDRVRGVNMETFPEALLMVSIVDPVMTPAQVGHLIDTLTNAQYADLASVAWLLNRELPTAAVRSVERVLEEVHGG